MSEPNDDSREHRHPQDPVFFTGSPVDGSVHDVFDVPLGGTLELETTYGVEGPRTFEVIGIEPDGLHLIDQHTPDAIAEKHGFWADSAALFWDGDELQFLQPFREGVRTPERFEAVIAWDVLNASTPDDITYVIGERLRATDGVESVATDADSRKVWANATTERDLDPVAVRATIEEVHDTYEFKTINDGVSYLARLLAK